MHFVDAPHVLDGIDTLDLNYKESIFTWYDRQVDGSIVWDTFHLSIARLEGLWKNERFHGVFAFSQGGVVAAVMAALPDRFPGLDFVICMGCPYVRQVYSRNPLGISEYDIPDSVRNIHFFGRSDMEVTTSSSMRLASLFTDPHFVEHEDGHCIPTSQHYANILINFVHAEHERIFDAHYKEQQAFIRSRLERDRVARENSAKEQYIRDRSYSDSLYFPVRHHLKHLENDCTREQGHRPLSSMKEEGEEKEEENEPDDARDKKSIGVAVSKSKMIAGHRHRHRRRRFSFHHH
jgi:hypothetical protein